MRGAGGLERQIEVHGLAAILHTAIIDACATPEVPAALEADFEPAIGDTNISTYQQHEPAYILLE